MSVPKTYQQNPNQSVPSEPNPIFKNIVADLRRMAKWSEIISFMEQHSVVINERYRSSPSIYFKNKRWLINTERLTIALVLVYRELSEKPAMSQGEFIRLLGGNPNREGLSQLETKEIKALNRYWENQMRNNIRPIMADYFQLIHIHWEGGDKPGCGEYSIRPSQLLVQFFEQVLYGNTD